MEREDKQLEGPDLARDQAFEQAEREEHEDQELPELVTEEVRDADFENRSRLFDALQLILAREHVNINLLYLPNRETRALEALQEAVNGADTMGEFVFAEDRRLLLEQALAVLQQNLTYGDAAQKAELESKYAALTGKVGELREALTDLEDAQEEIVEFHAAHDREVGDALPEVDENAPSSLTDGPPRKEPPAWTSTLEAPAIAVPAKPPSTLYGERAEAPKPPTTLVGPERPQPPKGPSTLGDLVEQALTGRHDPSPQTRLVKQPEPEKK